MRSILFFLLLLLSGSLAAQSVQTQSEALTDDAIQYAAQFGVTPNEALRRLRAQQASASVTEAIAREFGDRLAGISIEHEPDYRIVVLLKGSDPVPDRTAANIEIRSRNPANRRSICGSDHALSVPGTR